MNNREHSETCWYERQGFDLVDSLKIARSYYCTAYVLFSVSDHKCSETIRGLDLASGHKSAETY
jgi:hypothetical protein